MGQYITNVYISKNGKVTARPGDKVTLTDNQAAKMGSRVTPLKVAAPDKPFAEMTRKELTDLAKDAGIESYSTKNKEQLVEALNGQNTFVPVRADQAVTSDDSDA